MSRIGFRLAALALAGFLAAQALSGQARDLRMIVAGFASLSSERAAGEAVSIGYADAAAVWVPARSPFIQGIEIELRSPPEVARTPGLFAFEIWKSIDPAPEKGKFAYRGVRVLTQPLPGRAGYAFQIPLRADHSIERGPYAELLPLVIEASEFPIVIKMVPLSKGITPEIEKVRFQATFRPILGDEGALSLKLSYPEGEREGGPVKVLVDERETDASEPVELKAGAHRLRILSEEYRDEIRSFSIEAGKTLELAVALQGTTPILSIEAPDSAELSLDGRRLDSKSWGRIEVEPGERSVSCRIGDYSLTRRFVAAKGKSYKIVLEIDLRLQELP